MMKKIAIFALSLFVVPEIVLGTTCSRINLTRCLDSACAINLSSNPAARCQYCGTAQAGTPASNMRNISAGTSSKNTITARELRSAPSDPGERYIWATKLCLGRVENCTTEDVDETYDPLIEKSCTAAGVQRTFAQIQQSNAKTTRNANVCSNEISVCVTKSDKCNADYSTCTDDAKFDQFFAACASQSTGCTAFVDNIQRDINSTRKTFLSTVNESVESIAAAHKSAREQEITITRSNCSRNTEFDKCVATVCQNNTSDNCASDKSIATALCQFYKTACTKVK